MYRLFMALICTACAQASWAALPPQYQMARDLDVVIAFIKSHSRVASSLKTIDMYNYQIHFEKTCIAQFDRPAPSSPGMPGPLEPLQFKSSNCPIDY